MMAQKLDRIRLTIRYSLVWIFSLLDFAAMAGDSLKLADCVPNCSVSNCSELASNGNPLETRLVLLAFISVMLTIFLYQKYKKKIYLLGGIALSLGLVALLFIPSQQLPISRKNCPVLVSPIVGKINDTLPSTEFLPPNEDFQQSEAKDSFEKKATTNPVDSFQNAGVEFAPVGNEFSSSGETAKEVSKTTDEFAAPSSEFASADSTQKTQTTATPEDKPEDKPTDYSLLYQLAVLFSLLILISFLIKYESFRRTRGLFLMVTVVYLGFFKGACPCMILSFQNTILALLGSPVGWITLVWFLGLLPLTYFFGKVWCGWLCHLGGLQDFLFQSPKLELLKSQKAQKILRYSRIGLLLVLIIQLIITRSNLYIHYDPFKVAFNLFSANTTGYVLLVLLLISSVLIYRPFCRAVCPVGLILGWISMIPGARQLSKKDTCIDCSSCSKSCRSKAMIYEEKKSKLNVQDCILCGECMGSCKKNSLYIVNLKK